MADTEEIKAEDKEIEDMTEEELEALPKDPSEGMCTACEG